jgi:nicotinamidase-related amidase
MTRHLLDSANAVLMVIDIQERFVPIIPEAERLIDRTVIMVQAADALGIPVIVTEQYPQGLGHTTARLREALPKAQQYLEKTAFGCLGDAEIEKHLDALDRQQVMVCGLETHVCVNQTVHQLLEAGYEVHLIADALASREKAHYEIGLAKMVRSGAVHSCVEMALFELMRGSTHPQFKALQGLIK